MMEYLVRFAQCHESFRLPELHALASLTNVDLEVLTYETDVSNHLERRMSKRMQTPT